MSDDITGCGNNDASRNNDFAEKLRKFKEHILPASSALIITHDYPDPDCLASAYGVSHLLTFWGVNSSVISFGGFVGRAENRAMIRVLNIPTVPFVLTEIKDYRRIILVDCFPGKGNVPLPSDSTIHAVIDHHPHQPPHDATYFHDIRKEFGATSTIITKYLIEARCPITPKLATALFYGIKTDTGDMRRENVAEDVECYRLLFDIMDHRLLSRIENPDRDEEFFRILHRAVESTTTSESFGYTYLGNVSTPDYVAEMADLFHTLERLEWMVCSGVFKNHIFFSIRSKMHDTAGVIAEQLATNLGGSGGGHARVAAGRIPVESETINKTVTAFEQNMRGLFGISTIPEEKLL
ncbi:MAG: DHH family phosphoesterase [Chitinispirillaceae bacterium]|nr:DHH family phosphoesterase [Chitinispirillaceae bacterium]